MTTVKLFSDGKKITIDITGHAGFAGFSAGNDIVCAAISILSYTLMQRIQDMDDFNAFHRMQIDSHSGEVHIMVSVKDGYCNEMKSTLETILIGFELLNNQYPNNVFLDFSGGRNFHSYLQ